jgi:hypothetical protein
VIYLDYEGADIAERAQQLSGLEARISATQKSLTDLCSRYGLPVPAIRPHPPISPEALKSIFNHALDMAVPGSELIKIVLGTEEMPTSREKWVEVAVNTALELLPGGKFLRLVRSSAVGKIQGQILKLAAKKAKMAKKAAKQLEKATSIYKQKKGGLSGKEGAKDTPSWAKEHLPKVGESGKEFAKRILDQKYGPIKHNEGPGSDFSKIKKWADRSFE